MAFLVLKEHPKFFVEIDGVFNNKNGSYNNKISIVELNNANSDDSKLTINDSSSSSGTSTGIVGYVGKRKAKSEMRKRTEEKMMMQKVSDVCEVMSGSQKKSLI